MPIDPQHLAIGDPQASVLQQIGDVRRRLDALERTPTIQYGSGAPTSNEVRNGTPYAQGGVGVANFWLRIDGGWKAVALT